MRKPLHSHVCFSAGFAVTAAIWLGIPPYFSSRVTRPLYIMAQDSQRTRPDVQVLIKQRRDNVP